MAKLLTIAATNLRILFQNAGIWLNLLVLPIGIAFAVGLGNGASLGGGAPEAPSVLVDVIDRDASAESAAFLSDLKAVNPNLLLCPQDNAADDRCGLGNASHDEALANERLEARQTLALLIIPQGFADALATGGDVTLVYRSNEDASAPSYIRQAVDATVQRWSAAQVAANVGADVFANFSPTAGLDRSEVRTMLVEDATALWAEDPVRVNFETTAAVPQSDQGDGFGQSVPGIATMYVMFSVFPLIGAMIADRRNWTFQRLVMMPVSRAQVLGGVLLTYFVLGIIQFVVLFVFGALLGVRYGHDPLALVLIIVAYTACITALALALTTVIRTESQASGIALFLTMTLAPLGGAWWPLEIVPGWMQTVGHISPVAWAMDGFRSLIFYDGSLATVLLPVGVLFALAAVFFGIGIVRFQTD
jgi:ABC-2 type transport system permease protein